MNISLYTEGLAFHGHTLLERALGGSETAFICVARELARMGHNVTAYCVCDAEGMYDGVMYKHHTRVEELERFECDLFLCSRYFYCLFKPVRARVVILWLHDIMVPENAEWLEKICPRIDAIYCLSTYHAFQVASTLPEASRLMRLTVNGIDLAEIDEAVAAIDGKKHKIMFTSRPERGLLPALAHYEALGDTSLEMVVCSYSSLWDPEVNQLEFDCRNRIEYLAAKGFPITAGSFTKSELYRHIAESKAVIYPTDFPEIFCISAIEAQACGTAFLTTDDFALRETVGYERTPVGDPIAFRDRLVHVLADDDARRDLEQRGREHAREYTWERVARGFVREAERVEGMRRERRQAPIMLINRVIAPAPRPIPFLDARMRRRVANAGDRTPLETEHALRARYHQERERWATPIPAVTNGHALPMISCLTVTLNRLGLLKQAIQCYCDQTYPNRELVIVTDGSNRYKRAVEDYAAELGREDIKLVFLDGEHTLGRLRNISIESASGEIICQWDDDDLYHPRRLAEQAREMFAKGGRACFMTDHLQLFREERRMLWIDWGNDGWFPTMWNLVPGTLMMYKDDRFSYPETGPDARQGEDTAFLQSFYDKMPVARLGGMGYLYVYTYHGRNTYNSEHHRALAASSVGAERIQECTAELRRALAYYPIPKPYTLHANEDPVLVWNG